MQLITISIKLSIGFCFNAKILKSNQNTGISTKAGADTEITGL
jgi:hypothetical protein